METCRHKRTTGIESTRIVRCRTISPATTGRGALPKHVLIVDDEAGVRTVLGDMLEDAGYFVSLVSDGAEMRAFLKRDNSIDAVVLDSLMPGEDSTSLALHAKAMSLAVVMISGSNEKILFAEEHHLQMLQKPFRYDELMAAIEKALASGVFGQRDA